MSDQYYNEVKKSIEKGIQIMNSNEDVEAYLNSFSSLELVVIKIQTESAISRIPEGSLERNRLDIFLDILNSVQNRRRI